jgi:hypothetical protein
VKRVDVFPAVFLVADADSLQNYTDLVFFQDKPASTRRVDRCRVAIFNKKIYVVVDTPEGFKVIFREDVADYKKCENQHNALTTSGKIIAFRKDDNCGCGSRLRSWSPFKGQVYSSEDPDE